MALFSKEVLDRTMAACNVADIRKATIMEAAHMSSMLEQQTGIPFIHLELGSPGFTPNHYGIEAEREALEKGMGSSYSPHGGIAEAREAASEFLKAFLNIKLDPRCCILTAGSMQGSLASFISLTQYKSGKDKILFIDPSFSSQKAQLSMIGAGLRCFDIYSYRGAGLEARLEEELAHGDVAALIYSNPNNPSWICLEDSEIETIARLCKKYDVVPIEDLAYFCMDYRKPGLGIPYMAPYPPTIARYTDRYIILLSASKIFSYAGQRVAVMCIGEPLYNSRSEALATRYRNLGIFGPTIAGPIIDMMTCGPAMSCQYAFARMLRLSCEGVINFVEDTSEYGRRAAKMKEIFLANGFSIVYERDVTEKIGDGFFFTISYPGLDSGELAAALMEYGVSAVNLKSSGSLQEGVRVCSSRIHDEEFGLLEERMKLFNTEHSKR